MLRPLVKILLEADACRRSDSTSPTVPGEREGAGKYYFASTDVDGASPTNADAAAAEKDDSAHYTQLVDAERLHYSLSLLRGAVATDPQAIVSGLAASIINKSSYVNTGRVRLSMNKITSVSTLATPLSGLATPTSGLTTPFGGEAGLASSCSLLELVLGASMRLLWSDYPPSLDVGANDRLDLLRVKLSALELVDAILRQFVAILAFPDGRGGEGGGQKFGIARNPSFVSALLALCDVQKVVFQLLSRTVQSLRDAEVLTMSCDRVVRSHDPLLKSHDLSQCTSETTLTSQDLNPGSVECPSRSCKSTAASQNSPIHTSRSHDLTAKSRDVHLTEEPTCTSATMGRQSGPETGCLPGWDRSETTAAAVTLLRSLFEQLLRTVLSIMALDASCTPAPPNDRSSTCPSSSSSSRLPPSTHPSSSSSSLPPILPGVPASTQPFLSSLLLDVLSDVALVSLHPSLLAMFSASLPFLHHQLEELTAKVLKRICRNVERRFHAFPAVTGKAHGATKSGDWSLKPNVSANDRSLKPNVSTNVDGKIVVSYLEAVIAVILWCLFGERPDSSAHLLHRQLKHAGANPFNLSNQSCEVEETSESPSPGTSKQPSAMSWLFGVFALGQRAGTADLDGRMAQLTGAGSLAGVGVARLLPAVYGAVAELWVYCVVGRSGGGPPRGAVGGGGGVGGQRRRGMDAEVQWIYLRIRNFS